MSHVQSPVSSELMAFLKDLYQQYIRTKDIDQKSQFFSSSCRQICRPTPSFAAKDSSTIVQYLHAAASKDTESIQNSIEDSVGGLEEQSTSSQRPRCSSGLIRKRSFYSIRPLRDDEAEFGADAMVQLAGFPSVKEVERVAREEGWVGMRVDLWDDEELSLAGIKQGMLVKVRYWWRKEADQWLQIFHDIIYLGQRDGTEGSEGDIMEQ